MTQAQAKVDIDDLLSSMAECLIQSSVHKNEVYGSLDVRHMNEEIPLEVKKKPPKEIFYGRTMIASTFVPSKAPIRRCTCKYLCHGARAVTKCLSCALYDSEGVGYYCDLCFKHRHPWYRATHIYVSLDEDESINHVLQVQNTRLGNERSMVEAKENLQNIQKSYQTIELIKDDYKVDSKLKYSGRKVTDIEERMILMRRKLRNDLRKSGTILELSDDEASIIIQKYFRGYKIRRIISSLYIDRIILIKKKNNLSNGNNILLHSITCYFYIVYVCNCFLKHIYIFI